MKTMTMSRMTSSRRAKKLFSKYGMFKIIHLQKIYFKLVALIKSSLNLESFKTNCFKLFCIIQMFHTWRSHFLHSEKTIHFLHLHFLHHFLHLNWTILENTKKWYDQPYGLVFTTWLTGIYSCVDFLRVITQYNKRLGNERTLFLQIRGLIPVWSNFYDHRFKEIPIWREIVQNRAKL